MSGSATISCWLWVMILRRWTEALRLIQAERWRPQLVIALPAGFVGAVECKAQLRKCMQVPRLTNTGPKGGALWAAAVLNALLIEALNRLAAVG